MERITKALIAQIKGNCEREGIDPDAPAVFMGGEMFSMNDLINHLNGKTKVGRHIIGGVVKVQSDVASREDAKPE